MVDNAPLSCVVDHDNLFNQILAFMLCNTVWLRYSTRFSHSYSVAQFGYALQPYSCIHALQRIVWLRTSIRFSHSCPATQSLATHFNQIIAFMPCNTVWLRSSIRFSHSCSATVFDYALQPDSRIHALQHSLVTHFNQILAFMPCNTQFGYALQPDSCIHALQHIVWLRTSTRFSHSCPATQSLAYALQPDSRIHALQYRVWLRTSTRFSHSCPVTQSLTTHFNQILAFMPCNTEFGYALQPDSRIHALQYRVWLRTSTRFSNSCPAMQSLVTHFNQILEFMLCNTEFGYALQQDSRIHALQYRVWLRTSTRFSNSCPATHSLVTRYDDITITSIDQIFFVIPLKAVILICSISILGSGNYLDKKNTCRTTFSLETPLNLSPIM